MFMKEGEKMPPATVSVWILGDQLLHQHPALETARQLAPQDRIHVVLIQSRRRLQRLPYHAKKLVLLFSAMRHYADWLRDQGFQVDYVQAKAILPGLRQHIARHQSTQLITMDASECSGRLWQRDRLESQVGVPVTLLPNTQFLVSQYNPHPNPEPGKRYVMEPFYRAMRRHFDVLMEDDQPVGGQWNYDKLNRKSLPKTVVPPPPLGFEPDAITQQVMDEVASEMVVTGTFEGFNLAVTHAQAVEALDDFITHRFHDFGAYEDAMSSHHRLIFHSGLSPYLNIGLLEPMQLIRAAEAAYQTGKAPINSVEGFVRQILGWREFIWWQYWRQMPGIREENAWQAVNPLPEFFWSGQTDMNCLRRVLARVQEHGYAHHIERLMVLSNFCLLAGIEPLAVNDWFLSSFVDAYEWVMVPNVLGMGLNSDGGIIATKPYIASANYINKMSDYCTGCRFDKKTRTGEAACPFNFLYWNFLLEHEDVLRANPRLGRNVLGLRHLNDNERKQVRRQAAEFRENLARSAPTIEGE
jgi:deoxyribodipyrimidine photolyase-related protein